jgi:hypothetical protein
MESKSKSSILLTEKDTTDILRSYNQRISDLESRNADLEAIVLKNSTQLEAMVAEVFAIKSKLLKNHIPNFFGDTTQQNSLLSKHIYSKYEILALKPTNNPCLSEKFLMYNLIKPSIGKVEAHSSLSPSSQWKRAPLSSMQEVERSTTKIKESLPDDMKSLKIKTIGNFRVHTL